MRAQRRTNNQIAKQMRKSPRRDRYFGPQGLYHLELEATTRIAADTNAARLRKQHPGYGVRITHEGDEYQVWQAHFPGR